jgi:glycosyltransferase involved in cell wall biosynthesis
MSSGASRILFAPRFLFAPVSGASGMGEYARCISLADAVKARWPGAQIHFLLSEQAPYAKTTPYPHTLFPDSITKHHAAGKAAIRAFKPDIAIFDNAGRSGHMQAAAETGAVVYISSRWKPRYKAFRLSWMRHLREHWIPYPELIGGALSFSERFKLRLMGRPKMRYLDVMLPTSSSDADAAFLQSLGVSAGSYVLIVPGGGSAHPGKEHAAEAFSSAAEAIAAHAPALIAGVSPPPGQNFGARWLGRLPPAQIAALLRGAKLVVCNGGDTLLQALACGRACVAAPIAGDQPLRLARCAAQGGVLPVDLTAAALAQAAITLLQNSDALARVQQQAVALNLRNGMIAALDACSAILGE